MSEYMSWKETIILGASNSFEYWMQRGYREQKVY